MMLFPIVHYALYVRYKIGENCIHLANMGKSRGQPYANYHFVSLLSREDFVWKSVTEIVLSHKALSFHMENMQGNV